MVKTFFKKFGLAALIAILIFLTGMLAAWQFINHALEDKRDEMLFSMHLRAESLAWAAEGVSRLEHDRRGLSRLLAELGRQPGIAWIAVTSRAGRILADSNPELEGSLLYTASEMAALGAGPRLQGRFSPDDPNIFETWQSFRPGRLNHGGRHSDPGNVIFVAIDAANFKKDLRDYHDQLRLLAAFSLAACICFAALLFFIRNYRISRRGFLDARALSAQVVSSYPSPMLVTGVTGNIILANDPARRLLGAAGGKIQDMPGLDWHEILKTLGPETPIISREAELRFHDGKVVPAIVSAAVIKDAAGRNSGFLLAATDLTEIKNLERKLAESERISALGNLAAGIAHEIRNPLSSIRGYASYLKSRLASDPMGQATASLLEEETQRLNSALCDLLNLVKKPLLSRRKACMGRIMEKAAALAKPDADAKNISLKISLTSKDIPIDCDADKLLQAMLNLLLNAIQATQPGGNVEMRALFLSPESREARQIAQHGAWKLEIADNGPGMARDVLKKIFTPYFTTRAEGTGLGLTMTKQIIEAHGGVITARSDPGNGAVFAILLPAAPDTSAMLEDCQDLQITKEKADEKAKSPDR